MPTGRRKKSAVTKSPHIARPVRIWVEHYPEAEKLPPLVFTSKEAVQAAVAEAGPLVLTEYRITETNRYTLETEPRLNEEWYDAEEHEQSADGASTETVDPADEDEDADDDRDPEEDGDDKDEDE